MGGDRPKVLVPLRGRPLLAHVLDAVHAAGMQRIVVVTGHREAEVRAAAREATADRERLAFAHQPEPLGTGHAVACALHEIPRSGIVAILSGDVPLIRAATLTRLTLAAAASTGGLALASFRPEDPTGYGRVLRDARGRVLAIREHRDATEDERAVRECNAGIYAIRADRVHAFVPRLGRDNVQHEMYVTDLVELAAATGEVVAIDTDPIEAAGVNTLAELAALEAASAGRAEVAR